MKGYAAIIGVVALIIVTLWAVNARIAKAPGGGQACTMEAKLCPDGSAVGRTGPNCEFAACPSTSVSTTSSTTTLAIGSNATVNGTTIGVLGLVEDSRCPIDVQCIQAGTVRVRTSIDSSTSDFTFTLDQPQVVGNATITLASVIPAQKYSKQTVQPSDYRFTFTVVPKAISTSGGTTGVRGSVLLGPTCPVERIPPDPACADKPYATAIMVYRAGSSSPFVIGNSNASGAFEFSLPPGSYTLTAGSGKMLPRCASVDVTVATSGYIATTISCDTGIR
jgi:hypothetical protein